mmetsp:Transcript_96184/g.248721  ORF Transcript_96184/g.248721 Transcript_96184/m.248721 type:complete len:264 (+) Transcript_96184:327-1118(+)
MARSMDDCCRGYADSAGGSGSPTLCEDDRRIADSGRPPKTWDCDLSSARCACAGSYSSIGGGAPFARRACRFFGSGSLSPFLAFLFSAATLPGPPRPTGGPPIAEANWPAPATLRSSAEAGSGMAPTWVTGERCAVAVLVAHGCCDSPAPEVCRKGSASSWLRSFCTVKSTSWALASFGSCSLTSMHMRSWLPLCTLRTLDDVLITLVTPSIVRICSSIFLMPSGPMQFLRRSRARRYGSEKTSCSSRFMLSSSRPLSMRLIT